MNTDQKINFVQKLLTFAGAWLAARGYMAAEHWELWSGLILAIVTYLVSHQWNAAPTDKQTRLPLNVILFSLALASFTGCARMTVIQSKTNVDGSVSETRTHVTTFFDAHSDIQKLRTTSTDKSQGVSVGSITDDTSGTNATTLAGDIVSAAVSAAVKSAK